MACEQTAPYYSVDRPIYHNCGNCILGNNIETDKRESGNPGKRRLCQRCKDIRAGKITR